MSPNARDFKLGALSGNGPTMISGDGNSFTVGDVLKFDSYGNAISGGQVKTRLCIVTYLNSTTLRFAPAASASTPCTVGKSSTPTALATSVDVAVSGTSGTVWVGFDKPSGLPVVYQSTSGLASCSAAGCSVSTSNTPPGSFEPIWSWVVASGTVAANAGTDLVAEVATGMYPAAGEGITQTISNGQFTTAINTATVPSHLPVVSTTIDFASAANGACVNSNVTVSGVAANARILVGPPSSVTAGFIFSGWMSGTDTVKVQACNFSGGAVDLPSGTYKLEVLQ